MPALQLLGQAVSLIRQATAANDGGGEPAADAGLRADGGRRLPPPAAARARRGRRPAPAPVPSRSGGPRRRGRRREGLWRGGGDWGLG